MDQLFIKGKIKSTFFVILMLSVSILSGCVSDDGTIIVGDENENNDGGNETTNNTSNETSNDTGNETVNNTGNETVNNTDNNPLSLAEQCLSGHDNLAMHIHPLLKLTVRGTDIPIPENMGIDTFACPNAMHLLHTHDNTGKLHIETYDPITLDLSLFFAVWNISQPGDSTFEILFLDLDNVTITIDGVEQTVGINEVIFEDGISIHVVFDDSANAPLYDGDGDGLPDVFEQTQYGTDPNNPDTDGDGLSDGWEVVQGLDPLDPSDADLDNDNDGLNNLEEYWNGTDPNNPDTDGDGMPDGWEVVNGLDPLDPSDADLDNDMDNLSNLEEFDPSEINITSGGATQFWTSTDPNNPDSDGDGENDDVDLFPTDPNNGQYVDSDQDGYNDSVEIDCQSDYQDFNSIPQDTDGDGICDPLDPVNDLITMWSNNSAHFLYVKPDIIANSNTEDAKPYQIEFSANPMAEQNPVVLTQICDKGQGHVADVWSAFVLGPFPYDIISWHVYNTNGISIGMFVSRDNLTQSDNMTFPTVISTQDTENQSSGHLEAVVTDSQYYTCEFDYTDTDGDGVLDWMDAFPNDECAITDTDGDGMPDNILDGANDPVPNCQTNLIEDDDDDGDTCADNMDWAPLNSTECFDTDGDGIGDYTDPSPWITNDGNATFSMNYTMIGVASGHELYWLSQEPECPCYAYYYTTTPDMVWVDGTRSSVISHEYMPNVDAILALMGLTIDDLTVSTHPADLGTDTQGIEWDYDPNTGVEWRQLSSNLSILYIDDKPLFSINASMMLYLDYYPMMFDNPATMTGNSSYSTITSMLTANDELIYHQLFDAFFEDFGENNINYSFTSQDAIITNDYSFWDSTDPTQTTWLSSLIGDQGSIPGGLFESVVSEVNVEPSQNGITMSNSVNNSTNLAIFFERDEKDSTL